MWRALFIVLRSAKFLRGNAPPSHTVTELQRACIGVLWHAVQSNCGSPLQYASGKALPATVSTLLAAGADVNATNVRDYLPAERCLRILSLQRAPFSF